MSTSALSFTTLSSSSTIMQIGTAAGQASSTSSPSGAVVATSKSSNTGLAAGLGTGLGVAAIAVPAPAFFLFRKWRRDHVIAESAKTVPPYTIEMDGSPPMGQVGLQEHPVLYGGR